MSLMFYAYLLTSIGFAGIGIATFTYNQAGRLNQLYLALCVDLSLWALALSFMNITADADVAALFRRVSALFWSLAYCLILHLVIVLTRKRKVLKSPLSLLLLYTPGLISIYLYFVTTPLTGEHLSPGPVGWLFNDPKSLGFIQDHFFNAYYSSYILASLILVHVWGRRAGFKREKHQSEIIIVSFLVTLVLGTLTNILLPNLGLSILPPLAINIMLIAAAGIWQTMKKYRFLNLTPVNLAASVMKSMHEGMIIADQSGLIASVNDYAAEILGYASRDLLGRPLASIFTDLPDSPETTTSINCEMALQTRRRGELPVLICLTTLSDEWGEPYGSVLIFQDISTIKNIQNQLERSYSEIEIQVKERTKYLYTANDELKSEIAARIEMENQVSKMAYLDPLTGLANRRLFRDKMIQKIEECSKSKIAFSVIFLDLDAFKIVNDTLGHVHGDDLLKLVASRLSGCLRMTDTIGRVGGDEFLIMVHNTPDVQASEKVGNKLIDAFREPFKLDGDSIYITASIGISVYPADGEDADTLIKNADIAMYRAKERGKNKFEICNSALKNSLAGVMKLQSDLYRVIEHNELELYYQPQVDSHSGAIDGFEALLRWNHPERGLVGPTEFIPLAEKTGLIIPVGEWVLKTACRQNKAWQDQGLAFVPIAVNLSIKQLMDSDITGKVIRALSDSGLEPGYLELEITESVLMQDPDLVTSSLDKLKNLGVRISIDDFGTEYSSLHYLKQLPIDRIKIAMTFIHGIAINRKDEAIINAMIVLAENLDIDIIAEGVETQAQMEYLKKANCTDIQGFYYYRPMPAGSVQQLLGEGTSVCKDAISAILLGEPG